MHIYKAFLNRGYLIDWEGSQLGNIRDLRILEIQRSIMSEKSLKHSKSLRNPEALNAQWLLGEGGLSLPIIVEEFVKKKRKMQ